MPYFCLVRTKKMYRLYLASTRDFSFAAELSSTKGLQSILFFNVKGSLTELQTHKVAMACSPAVVGA